MKTNNTELKVRAKRLRTAIKVVLGVDATNSQALELVAREENFPTWDAASACYGDNTSIPEQLAIRPKYLRLEQIRIRSPYIMISGNTATGKTILAHDMANHLADGSTTICGAKAQGPISVVVISHIKECNSESFMAPSDRNFEEKLGYIDFSRTVLLIDDCVGHGDRDKFWLDLARKAYAAVVTLHTGALDELDAEAMRFFQQVNCNVSKVDSEHVIQ